MRGVLLFYTLVVVDSLEFNKRPLVTTKHGDLLGVNKTSCYQTPYYAFHNIPYARPPIGQFRFRDPQPLDRWIGVRDASEPGNVCHQFDRLRPGVAKIIGSDDCLTLNVYTKNLTPDSPLPVMVYIHGGRFANGNGGPPFHNPDYLIEHDVVVVSINYRLAAFGFLSFKDPSIGIPGNAGLKDQTMALKWVKENIVNFGGDPNSVTLFGESAGGCSVHLHLLSPMSEGLFHRAILMSGTAMSYRSLGKPNIFALRLARAVGYMGSEDEKSVFEYLQQTDPEKLVAAELTLYNDEERLQIWMNPFAPTVEPYKSEQTFLLDTPVELAKTAWGQNVDIIIGGLSEEGLVQYSTFTSELFETPNLFGYLVSSTVNASPHSTRVQRLGEMVKQFYYKDEIPSMENVNNYVDLLTDKIFWHGIYTTIQSRQKYGLGKTWLYHFSVPPKTNQFLRESFKIPHTNGMCHAEDLYFVFRWDFVEPPIKGSDEFRVIQKFVSSILSLT